MMCYLAPPLLLVDQPTPNMFDYANTSATFSHHHHHHHPTTMPNWSSAFQLQSTIETNHHPHI